MIPLQHASQQPLARVGGKAKALGRLFEFGAPVPPGFVVPPTFNVDTDSRKLLASFDELGSRYVAVRSSAAGEDSDTQSWAGQFESYLYVSRTYLLKRVSDCRLSGSSARAQSYDPSITVQMPIAVVVQTMVLSEVAGVLFTADPVTNNSHHIVVEAVYGLGEQLVQGLATPDHYRLNRPAATLELLRQLCQQAVQLEMHFGQPLDIEWA